MEFDQMSSKQIIEIFRFSIASLFWLGLWFFGLVVLLSFFMRWWPGDQLRNVRFLNYFMPWLLVGLVPGIIIASLAHQKWLAAALFAPTFLICISYLPLFLKSSNTATANGVSLKVMSYNVWRKNLNMASAAKVIRKEQPDILLLQEVNSYRIKTLVDELRDLYSDTKLKLIHDPEILQAVISRYPLKPLEASPQKGRSQKVLVETPYGRIIVINIHTYIWGWIRRHQQMTRLIKEDVALTNDPIILGGDFNTSDQSQTYRLVNQYLKNAHWEAGCGFGFTYPSSSFRFKRKFSISALIRIDHIFYSAHFIPRSARTLNESGGSDHLPVVAEFVLI